MNRETVVEILSKHKELLKNYGVREIRLFGSVARGEETPDSDVDLLVEFDPSAHIGMFEYSRLRNELSQLLGCKVDLATVSALHKGMKADILKEAIRAA